MVGTVFSSPHLDDIFLLSADTVATFEGSYQFNMPTSTSLNIMCTKFAPMRNSMGQILNSNNYFFMNIIYI